MAHLESRGVDMMFQSKGGDSLESPLLFTSRSLSMQSIGCNLDTSYLYNRASGGSFPFGGVGLKPRTMCGVPMSKIEMETKLYKTVWWGLQEVGKYPVRNFGVRSLTDLKVLLRCDDYRKTTFRAVVHGTVTTFSGKVARASAWEQEQLPCGTRP